jgi:hypothetical protein
MYLGIVDYFFLYALTEAEVRHVWVKSLVWEMGHAVVLLDTGYSWACGREEY